jgi:hypothetical protein
MMQVLRWKSRFNSGDHDTDRDNKALVACLNSLIDAVRHHHHCSEVEDVLQNLSQETETQLNAGIKTEAIRAHLRAQFLQQLPLPNYKTQSCHSCGICDLAQQQVAANLETPSHCLALSLTEKNT